MVVCREEKISYAYKEMCLITTEEGIFITKGAACCHINLIREFLRKLKTRVFILFEKLVAFILSDYAVK